ncbi:hypothetical protein Bca52824_053205 [Brassica carinata]|uniref:beta-galactosidase n=1 Tax=Brassica carinata TaxID=52824 RepID=A0A8X7UJF1_BRACI|nr:hypothetical protein Bca52824_053205 [Brassica carinata]
MASFRSSLALFILMAIIGAGDAGNVTYDGRSLIIDGQHKILFSGSIHYPRSTPHDTFYLRLHLPLLLLRKAKSGGIDVIDTYVFWNIHEPQQGKFDFSGRCDIVRFIKVIQAHDLYVCLRIGPFIQGEWSYGGLPFLLHNYYMKRYAQMIVKLMKSENLYASQGGPIILSHLELFKQEGKSYVKWAAKLDVELDTGVPWVMCKQDDAPDPLINACNGRQCGETFKGPNSPNKPAVWTENWTSFYQTFGEEPLKRSAEDIAFQVALFIARNGSFINYYMVVFLFTLSLYFEYTRNEWLLRQPKWGHLKELHAAVKLCEKPLLSGLRATTSLGKLQTNPELCAAFLMNQDEIHSTVHFLDSSYTLSPNSISVLPHCKNVDFNTAKVNAQYTTRTREPRQKLSSSRMWEEYTETVPSFSDTTIRSEFLLEHMNTTQDTSDYLWQIFRFQQPERAESILKVNHIGHVLHAFVNGRFIGSMHRVFKVQRFLLEKNMSLINGTNSIALLSVMVGLPNSGAHLERRVGGSRSVKIWNGTHALYFNKFAWGYEHWLKTVAEVGLHGEQVNVYTDHGAATVQWKQYTDSKSQPLTWDRSYDLELDINGKRGSLSEWPEYRSMQFSEAMALLFRYHIPRSFLNPNSNLLVILEEEKEGNPLGITIDTVPVTEVCGYVSSSHLPPVVSSRRRSHNRSEHRHLKYQYERRLKVQLQCPYGKKISKVLFASFGSPKGNCWRHSIGSCHSPNSLDVVQKACLRKSRFCTSVEQNIWW